MASQPTTQRRHDRAIAFVTQEEVRRLFSVIKNRRDRAAIIAVAYRHGRPVSEIDILQSVLTGYRTQPGLIEAVKWAGGINSLPLIADR